MNHVTDNRGPMRLAPLQNVQLMMQLLHRVCDAPDHLTNWGVVYAPPGFGKTTAIHWAQSKRNAMVIEAKVTWTMAAVVEAMERELSIPPTRQAVYKREDKVVERLSDDPLPLIFDEANHLCKKKVVELIREISQQSRCPVIMVGTQTLKEELKEFPVAASRVLEWLPGRPCNGEDVKALARLYGEDVTLAEDLLRMILAETKGVTRQVVANIDRARNLAVKLNTKTIDLATFRKSESVFAGAPSETWEGSMRKQGVAA